MDRLDKGASRVDATLDARKLFVDYDINAPLIKGLKIQQFRLLVIRIE